MLLECPTRKTATNARETLSSVLGLAVAMERIDENYARGRYDYPQRSIRNDERFGVWMTTFGECMELLEAARKRDGCGMFERILVLGLCFGLRNGEIFGLNWGDVDFGRRLVKVRRTYVVGESGAVLVSPKTERGTRDIPMSDYAEARLLAFWRADAPEHGDVPVVRGPMGKRCYPKVAGKRFRKFIDQGWSDGYVAPRVTIMSLRHSFATAAIRSGMSVAAVSKILGHASTSVTVDRYVRYTVEDVRAEMPAIEAAMGIRQNRPSQTEEGEVVDR